MSGILNLVSVGPGFADLIVPRAIEALRQSDVIVAYELYLRWIEPYIEGKEIHTPPLTQERERALLALEKARGGARVSLISSGDIGIYAMAALAYDDMREDDTFEVRLIPGVTSANACASLLGSPLSHDFATLSLSDLLCPWEWIESRARHIAQADLACVMYNVQSAGRQEGVYRILKLMLESKAPTTLCGVVRNAYRPGQTVAIHELQELPSLKFDMLTTIVVGNRFTQRKRDWIYTPRGYNDWPSPAMAATDPFRKAAADKERADAQVASAHIASAHVSIAAAEAAASGLKDALAISAASPVVNIVQSSTPSLPPDATWVFAGTGDGNALAQQLAADGAQVVVSTATEYGGELAAQDCPGLHVWAGRQGVDARRQMLAGTRARVIVDATHPFATVMSSQLMGLARELNIPYLRYERPSALDTPAARDILTCADMDEAARLAVAGGKRIFLATGSKDLQRFLQAPGADACTWFARVTAEPEFIQRALDLGIARSRLCAMQGPFSAAFNQALWTDWKIDYVVTKDSGAAGGFDAKAQAAAALGVPLLVVRRPALAYPVTAATFDDVRAQLAQLPQSSH